MITDICLLDAIKKYNTNILALQEIRWPNEGSMKKEDKTIFYSGRKDGKHENGVDFIVSDDTLPQVKDFTAVNDRLCYIRIAGRIFDIIIINAYAPTEEKEENLKNDFYDDLDNILDTTMNSCIKILIEKLSDRDVLKEYICKTQQELQKTNEKIEESENVERIWDRIRIVVVDSADNCLGIKEKEKRKEWFIDRFSAEKRFTVLQHLKTEKHIKSVNRIDKSKKSQQLLEFNPPTKKC
ncbi:hypothetical protein QTP88_022016 [Uroleucon formosanum]